MVAPWRRSSLFLPRKFKIAISGGAEDRAAVRFHDIGARARATQMAGAASRSMSAAASGAPRWSAGCSRASCPARSSSTTSRPSCGSINRHGRRDNKYKARIKILVKDLSLEGFAREVEDEWAWSRGGPATLGEEDLPPHGGLLHP